MCFSLLTMLGFLILFHIIQLSSSEYTYECECKKSCTSQEINSTIKCGEYIWCCIETVLTVNKEKTNISEFADKNKNSSIHVKEKSDTVNLVSLNDKGSNNGGINNNTNDSVNKNSLIPDLKTSDTYAVDWVGKTRDDAHISRNSSFITNDQDRNSPNIFLRKQNTHDIKCDGQIHQRGISCFDQKTFDIGNLSDKSSVLTIINNEMEQEYHSPQLDRQMQQSQDLTQLDVQRRNGYDDTGHGHKPSHDLTQLNVQRRNGYDDTGEEYKPGHDLTQLDVQRRNEYDDTGQVYKPGHDLTQLDVQRRNGYDDTGHGYTMFQHKMQPTNTDNIQKQNQIPNDILYKYGRMFPEENRDDYNEYPLNYRSKMGPQFYRRPLRFMEFYQIPAELFFDLPYNMFEEYNKRHSDSMERDRDLFRLSETMPRRFYGDFEENAIPPHYVTHRSPTFSHEYSDVRKFRSKNYLQKDTDTPFNMIELKSNVFQSFADENNPYHIKLPLNRDDMWP